MSKVSRTTIEKRQIASLASELGSKPVVEVNGEPIDDKDVGQGGVINPEGEISGYIHCVVQVAASGGRDNISETIVWSAEQDGSISFRNGVTGEALYSKDMNIPAKGRSFVRCMVACKDLVWAGYADGHVRAYNIETHDMVLEKKRHAGGINAIVAAANNTVICTASDDFRIVLWSIDELAFLHQLPGHSNRVKTLFVDGGFLFSGGDDGYVRCWNVAEKGEVVVHGQYPFLAHRNGVKALTISDNVVFTGGEGGVALWDVETTDLLHNFPSASPITRLAVVEADVALWACSVDGMVTVWDLFNFEKVGRITVHAATGINDIRIMSRSVANRLFCVTTNSLEVAYAESDGMRQGYEPVPEEVVTLYKRIDELRKNVSSNSQALRERAKHLRRLQALDDHQKTTIMESMRQIVKNSLKRSYFDKAMAFLKLRQNENKRMIIADTMLSNTSRGLSFLYFTKWVKFQRLRKDTRQRHILVESLLRNTQRGLQSLYLKQALEFVREKENNEARLQTAEIIMSQSTRGLQKVVFFKWVRWAKHRAHLSKRQGIYENMLRNTDKGTMTIYFNKLAQYAKEAQRKRVRAATTELLASHSERGLRLVALAKWRKLVSVARHRRQREGLASIMATNSDAMSRRLAFSKLLAFVKQKKQMTLAEKLEAMDARIAELDRIVNDPNILSEEELDRQIAAAEEDIAAAEQEVEEIKNCIVDLEVREADLTRELANNAAVDPSKPLQQQIDLTAQMLKGTGINCKAQLELITDISKRAALPRAGKPSMQFAKAMEEFRVAAGQFAEEGQTIKAGELWPLDNEGVNKASKAMLRKTLLGARKAVVLWDHIVAKDDFPASVPEDNTNADLLVPGAQDLLMNATWINQMMARENKLTAEQVETAAASSKDGSPTTGRPQGKRSTSSSASARPRTAAATTSRTTASSTTARPGAKPAAKTSTATRSTTGTRSTSTSASTRPATTSRATTSSAAGTTRTARTSTTASSTRTASTRPGAKPASKVSSTTRSTTAARSSATQKKEEPSTPTAAPAETKKEEEPKKDEPALTEEPAPTTSCKEEESPAVAEGQPEASLSNQQEEDNEAKPDATEAPKEESAPTPEEETTTTTEPIVDDPAPATTEEAKPAADEQPAAATTEEDKNKEQPAAEA